MSDEIQAANLAGRWYPADPRTLRADVEALIDRAGDPAPRARGIIVPHAAHRYSGRAAGSAFAHVERGRWRRAVVLAPSHHHEFAGAALFPGKGFQTPLGVAAVDRTAVGELAASPGFVEMSRPYADEHSVEIQLPFLQVIDPDILVVPVLVGFADDAGSRAALAAGLRPLDDGETLFVVSSDFTHYGTAFDYLPFPAEDVETVAREIRRLDFGAVAPILSGDCDRFVEYVRETGITVCGREPIALFLCLAKRRLLGRVSCYYTSLDVTGDCAHSVSYAAVVFELAAEPAE